MFKVVKLLNFVLQELSALALGLYTSKKLWNLYTPSLNWLDHFFSPDFTCGLQSKGYWLIVLIGSALWNKMATMPIYGKKHLKVSLSSTKKAFVVLVYSVGDSRSTKFAQMMILGWPLTFLCQGQVCISIHLYGENVEKSFSTSALKTNGWNLHCMHKVVKLLVTIKILSPGGHVPLPLGYIQV